MSTRPQQALRIGVSSGLDSYGDRGGDLLNGPVDAVRDLRNPSGTGWLNPDLFWPDDRRWFVATDVDFWSMYVAGSTRFVEQVAESAPTPCSAVELDAHIANED